MGVARAIKEAMGLDAIPGAAQIPIGGVKVDNMMSTTLKWKLEINHPLNN